MKKSQGFWYTPDRGLVYPGGKPDSVLSGFRERVQLKPQWKRWRYKITGRILKRAQLRHQIEQATTLGIDRDSPVVGPKWGFHNPAVWSRYHVQVIKALERREILHNMGAMGSDAEFILVARVLKNIRWIRQPKEIPRGFNEVLAKRFKLTGLRKLGDRRHPGTLLAPGCEFCLYWKPVDLWVGGPLYLEGAPRPRGTEEAPWPPYLEVVHRGENILRVKITRVPTVEDLSSRGSSWRRPYTEVMREVCKLKGKR